MTNVHGMVNYCDSAENLTLHQWVDAWGCVGQRNMSLMESGGVVLGLPPVEHRKTKMGYYPLAPSQSSSASVSRTEFDDGIQSLKTLPHYVRRWHIESHSSVGNKHL